MIRLAALALSAMLAVPPATAASFTVSPDFAALAVLPSADAPAERLSAPRAPEWSQCPELYEVALANWPGAVEDWWALDHIFWRENRCGRYPESWVNPWGCVGLMQVCPSNFKRMSARIGLPVNRETLKDFGFNMWVGWNLAVESTEHHRSWLRPWWTKKWRP